MSDEFKIDDDWVRLLRQATALDMAGRSLRPLERLQEAKRNGAHPRVLQRLERLCELPVDDSPLAS